MVQLKWVDSRGPEILWWVSPCSLLVRVLRRRNRVWKYTHWCVSYRSSGGSQQQQAKSKPHRGCAAQNDKQARKAFLHDLNDTDW